MEGLANLEIRNFKPVDQGFVKEMILSGLKERWGFLDHNKNPDLNDIARNYRNGLFLVAEIDSKIAGCGAMKFISTTTVEIVRMAILAPYRKKGIGSKILGTLINNAYKLGYQYAFLETTATWFDAVAFYKKNGFHISCIHEGDLYFMKHLQKQCLDKSV